MNNATVQTQNNHSITPSKTSIEDKTREELEEIIQVLQTQLQFVQSPETISKREIVTRIGEIADLSEEDFMDVEEDYNMGLKKSGWLKLYQYLVQHGSNQENNT